MPETSQNNPNPEQLDEQLVSYLDGELEPAAAERVEHLLAADEQARSRLSQLAASWDLLDQLPRATVDDLFTRTTVEMVAVAAEEELARTDSAAPARRRRRWLEGGLATAVAAVIGFVLVAVAMPNQNDALLEDLPVIYDLQRLRPVGDIEFLKEYDKERLFPDDLVVARTSSTPPQSGHSDATTGSGVTKPAMPIPTSIHERRQWVESLSVPEKIALRDNFEAFTRLSPKVQQSLRALEEQLRDQPALQQVMQRYIHWHEPLEYPQKKEIAYQTTPKDRVAKIRERQQFQDRATVRELSRFDPKDPDDAAIVRWMRAFAGKNLDELSTAAGSQRPGRGARGNRPPISLAFDVWWGPSATKSPQQLTDDDLAILVEQLSEEKQQQFAAASEMDLEVTLLKRWIQKAVRAARTQVPQSGRGRGGPNIEFLQQQFEKELTPEQRRELQALPENERQRKRFEFFQKLHPEIFRPGEFPRSLGPPPPREGGSPPERQNSPPPSRPEAP